MPQATRTPYIALIGKIIRIIELLRDSPDGLSLQALATQTGYVKSSIHRVLLSLAKHGYVEQDSRGGVYRLGLKFLAVGRAVNGNVSVVAVARPHLRELLATFDETAYLAILRGDRGIFVDVQETTSDLRLVGPVGAEVHFHATAAGKAMAAALPEDRRRALLRRLPLPRLTARTITARTMVEREWLRVRRTGVAVNREETIQGAIFLASAVFDVNAAVCGALSVGIPKARHSSRIERALATALKDTSRRLSDTLAAAGYVHSAGFAPAAQAGRNRLTLLAG